jgi:hypothetical protein
VFIFEEVLLCAPDGACQILRGGMLEVDGFGIQKVL